MDASGNLRDVEYECIESIPLRGKSKGCELKDSDKYITVYI